MDTRYLTPQFFQLSKSTFVKGMQCPKYLYLNKHKPKEKTPHDAEILLKFREGKDFEAIFKDRFAPATDVSAVLGRDVYTIGAAYTKAALDTADDLTLLEACFIHDKTLIMTDVLRKNKDGSYEIYEIKNSEDIKEVFLWDLSLQYYICRAVLKAPLTFNIVLNDGYGGYQITDLSDELMVHEKEMAEKIGTFLALLRQEALPEIPAGPQCTYPYPCEFIAYCNRKK